MKIKKIIALLMLVLLFVTIIIPAASGLTWSIQKDMSTNYTFSIPTATFATAYYGQSNILQGAWASSRITMANTGMTGYASTTLYYSGGSVNAHCSTIVNGYVDSDSARAPVGVNGTSAYHYMKRTVYGTPMEYIIPVNR